MSVPGVFPATEVNGRILGDGGLVDNVPVDVARAMGADIVIVVNIGTPLAGRDPELGHRAHGPDDQHPDRAERAAQPGFAGPA
jgi:predicted acylesterase/phospholipase RssA